MSKHTPGTWQANDVPNCPEPDFRYATAVWSERVAADGGEPINVLVCSVHPDLFHDWQPKPKERTANARLIAAAPELLEACQAAIEETGGSAIWNGGTKRFLEMCEAAIAKAVRHDTC